MFFYKIPFTLSPVQCKDYRGELREGEGLKGKSEQISYVHYPQPYTMCGCIVLNSCVPRQHNSYLQQSVNKITCHVYMISSIGI